MLLVGVTLVSADVVFADLQLLSRADVLLLITSGLEAKQLCRAPEGHLKSSSMKMGVFSLLWCLKMARGFYQSENWSWVWNLPAAAGVWGQGSQGGLAQNEQESDRSEDKPPARLYQLLAAAYLDSLSLLCEWELGVKLQDLEMKLLLFVVKQNFSDFSEARTTCSCWIAANWAADCSHVKVF